MKKHITRVALLDDGICVWFGNAPKFDEGDYYAHMITSMGKEGVYDMSTALGWVEHMSEKVWWNKDLEGAFLTECENLIGRHGRINLTNT